MSRAKPIYHVYIFGVKHLTRLIVEAKKRNAKHYAHPGDSRNLECLTCGKPVWKLLGEIVVSKRRGGLSFRRGLDCAITSNLLSCNTITIA